MCGIAGFVNLDGAPGDVSVLGAMTDRIRHRGPDDRGTLCLSLRGAIPDTALGFHRLRVLDLSARGHQPMTSPDGSTALLFNGEIDPAEVDELLAFRYVAGEASLLKGVRHVQPGHRLTITPDGVREAPDWHIPDHSEKLRLSREDAVDRLDHLLGRSVQSQLRSDVNVGCQLSVASTRRW